MKPFVWILLAGLILAPPGLALKQTPETGISGAHDTELSDELGAFVRQAVKEGLLSPSGSGAPPAEEAPTGPKSIVAAPAALAPGALDCTQPYPLDFVQFSGLTTYADIYAYREDSPAAGAPEGQEGHPGITLAKAYLSLDLASEAIMTVKSARDQEAVALQNLGVLLEGYAQPPVAYFASLAACYPEAQLWHAISLIAAHDKAGVPLLQSNLSEFRQLPLQLRDRAAMIAVPRLDGLGERKTAQLLIAAFSPEEIAHSAQLRFSEAVIELGSGDPEAEQLIGKFLVQSRFQEPALSALIRHKRPVSNAVREILLDEMVTRIELAQTDANVRDDLDFVLDELSTNSMYLPMMKLADLPSMQNETAQQELRRQLVAGLKRDLESEESLRNLAAIEALIKDPGLLDGLPERAGLYETATEVAVGLGFGTLGDALSAKAEGGEGVAAHRAVLAYRQKNTEELNALAARYPANQKIALIAAMSAIDARDPAKLAVFESRLTLEPETVLTLIEQDAAAGNWIVSQRVYNAAAELTDEAQRRRVERVLRLKQAPEIQPASGRLPMSTIQAKLDRSRDSLKQLSGEAP